MGADEPKNPEPRSARDAVERLFHEHAGRLYGMGLKMCGDPDEAEDLVQETFIRAYRSWDGFRGDSSPSTWLYTIAARVCQRMHRRRAGEPPRVESLTQLLPSGDEAGIDIASEEDSPYEAAVRRETRNVVREAAAQLPARYRLPLALKDLLELPTEEVAEILSLKPSTVRSRVHRARLLLAREVRRRLAIGASAAPADPARLCLDLLGLGPEVLAGQGVAADPDEALCARCIALYASLDLSLDGCRELAEGTLPVRLRGVLDRVITPT